MHIKSGALYSEWPNSPGARSQALAYLHTAVPSDHRSALLSFQSETSFFFSFFLGDPLNTRLPDMWQLVGTPVASGIIVFRLVQPKYYYYQKQSRADNKDSGRCAAGGLSLTNRLLTARFVLVVDSR